MGNNYLKHAVGFVIFDKSTKEFSDGKSNPWGSFSSTPKIWPKLQHLKSHLNRQIYFVRDYPGTNHHYEVAAPYHEPGPVVIDISTGAEVLDVYVYLLENKERKELKKV